MTAVLEAAVDTNTADLAALLEQSGVEIHSKTISDLVELAGYALKVSCGGNSRMDTAGGAISLASNGRRGPRPGMGIHTGLVSGTARIQYQAEHTRRQRSHAAGETIIGQSRSYARMILDRLAEKGIVLPTPPQPAGAYSPVVLTGNWPLSPARYPSATAGWSTPVWWIRQTLRRRANQPGCAP